MIKQEQIIRQVKLFGNGAHIFVPKEWIGEQIIIIKPEKKPLKERVLEVLGPYLDSVIGAYIYGSYARDEQTEDSDIDLFVITDKKVKIKSEGFELICLEEKDIKTALKIEPVLIYSILSESKPLINSKVLDELRSKYVPKLLDFQNYFKETESILRVSEDFIKLERGEYLASEAVVYSLVLRLRGLFIIKSILEGKIYSHRLFKSWIKSHISEIDFDSIYEAYRFSKYEKKTRQKIKVSDIKLLMEFLKNEINKIK